MKGALVAANRSSGRYPIDHETDTALHPFVGDGSLCEGCGEHTSWHPEPRENMQPHWIKYAVWEDIAICMHRSEAGYCVCVQHHPPSMKPARFACLEGVPLARDGKGRVYEGPDKDMGLWAFDSWATALRKGDLHE